MASREQEDSCSVDGQGSGVFTRGLERLGAGIAKRLGAAGAAVVVNYASSREGAERVVAEIVSAGGKGDRRPGDVSKAPDVQRLFAETHPGLRPAGTCW